MPARGSTHQRNAPWVAAPWVWPGLEGEVCPCRSRPSQDNFPSESAGPPGLLWVHDPNNSPGNTPGCKWCRVRREDPDELFPELSIPGALQAADPRSEQCELPAPRCPFASSSVKWVFEACFPSPFCLPTPGFVTFTSLQRKLRPLGFSFLCG